METIFTELKKRNVCYAVGVAYASFKIRSAEIHDLDYFVIVDRKDNDKFSGLLFRNAKPASLDVLERDMNDADISEFKSNQDKYIQVQKNRDGRVYELKRNRFKEYYMNNKLEE